MSWLLLVLMALGPTVAEGSELNELRERLEHESPRTRRSAVESLARHGNRDAWELILGALADPEAEVADAAQLAFGGLDDPGFVGALLGRSGARSREGVVARRACEALGRVRAEVDAQAVAERLGGVDRGAQRLLVWSIERLATAGRITGDLDRLGRVLGKLARSKRDPALAGDALRALAALDAHAVAPAAWGELSRLASAARSSSKPELRCAALAVASGEVGRVLDEREVWARGLSADKSTAVRLQAIEALERLGTRSAAQVLVERLEREAQLQVRWRVLRALRAVSGRKHRFDPRPWRRWLEECPDGWLATPSSRASLEDAGGGTRAEGLGTLELRGDRVCFLFDFSGSMWEELPDGRTPKLVVDGQLREALERLQVDTAFNLIPYAHEPVPWRETVVAAKPKHVRAALDFFEGLRLRGRGNVWDAFGAALEDPAVDSIVVLTDGYPTGGDHADMDLIAPLFGFLNRYRRVTVDAVLVDAGYGDIRRWSELTGASGGRCVEVSLRR